MAESTATLRRLSGSYGHGFAGTIKHRIGTVELAASSSGDTIDFGNIPSNARIMGISQLYWDDLATSGSPTLDVGLFAVDSNITDDPDALNDGLALSSASTGSRVVKAIENYGKRAWEYVNAQTSDPGGELKVKGTVKDASTTATGTVTLELLYSID